MIRKLIDWALGNEPPLRGSHSEAFALSEHWRDMTAVGLRALGEVYLPIDYWALVKWRFSIGSQGLLIAGDAHFGDVVLSDAKIIPWYLIDAGLTFPIDDAIKDIQSSIDMRAIQLKFPRNVKG